LLQAKAGKEREALEAELSKMRAQAATAQAATAQAATARLSDDETLKSQKERECEISHQVEALASQVAALKAASTKDAHTIANLRRQLSHKEEEIAHKDQALELMALQIKNLNLEVQILGPPSSSCPSSSPPMLSPLSPTSAFGIASQ
jgi:hypothetical protein